MIGKALRGRGVAGLVRYLYGPGKANEHVDPRLVAAWDTDLASLEPTLRAASSEGGRDFRALVSRLNEPLVIAGLKPEDRPVYHLIVAAAKADPARGLPADRHLDDGEWGAIARDYMHRTGLAPRDDPDGVRWIAVRHDDQHIHIVATLARQDGRRCWPKNDFYRIGEASRAAETAYGLRPTAPSDRTSARTPTRAETEKATRTGKQETDREQLRRLVRAAAAATSDRAEFVDRLRRDGVAVRLRHSTRPGHEHEVTGYSVALAGPTPKARGARGAAAARGAGAAPAAEGVWFSGGKLAADLTLPQLTFRWDAARAAGPDPLGPGKGYLSATDRITTVTAAVDEATTYLQQHAGTGAAGRGQAGRPEAEEVPVRGRARSEAGPADAAAAAGELTASVAAWLDGDRGGPATRASALADRAARAPWARVAPTSTPAGSALRAAARMMAATAPAESRNVREITEMLQAIGRMFTAIAELRAVQARAAQAQAAATASQVLLQSLTHYPGDIETQDRRRMMDLVRQSFPNDIGHALSTRTPPTPDRGGGRSTPHRNPGRDDRGYSR